MNKEDRNSFRKEIIGKLEEQWVKSNSRVYSFELENTYSAIM